VAEATRKRFYGDGETPYTPPKETLIKATLPGFFVREAATPKFASS
jgi:hypothetical protein